MWYLISMLRRPRFWLVILGLGLIFYFDWKFEHEDFAYPERELDNAHSNLHSAEPKANPVPPPVLPPSDTHRASATSHGLIPKLIPFVVEDGMAVAGGDILLGVPTASGIHAGNAEPSEIKFWESRRIPYLISPELPSPERVQAALDILAQQTPVRFVRRSPEYFREGGDGIIFEPTAENCVSYLGRIGGLQPIRLSATCATREILHEVLHSLGFVHEHTRTDRDAYVDILWDNIDERFHAQFEKAPEVWMEPVRSFTFDYRSVMLYPPTLFARSKDAPALRSRTEQRIRPNRERLSEGDQEKVRFIYGTR